MEVQKTEPGYSLAVVASKVFSRRELRGILSGQRLGPSFTSRSLTIQFLRVGGGMAEVFKVLAQDRIQQQRTWSRSLTFQLAEVCRVSPQAGVPELPHRVNCLTMQMREFKEVFALFPGPKKVRR